MNAKPLAQPGQTKKLILISLLRNVGLAFKINKIIKKRKLTQVEAAKTLESDQSKISLLNCGRLSSFSIERLVRYLNLLDQLDEARRNVG